jgi:hypothetical protein
LKGAVVENLDRRGEQARSYEDIDWSNFRHLNSVKTKESVLKYLEDWGCVRSSRIELIIADILLLVPGKRGSTERGGGCRLQYMRHSWMMGADYPHLCSAAELRTAGF